MRKCRFSCFFPKVLYNTRSSFNPTYDMYLTKQEEEECRAKLVFRVDSRRKAFTPSSLPSTSSTRPTQHPSTLNITDLSLRAGGACSISGALRVSQSTISSYYSLFLSCCLLYNHPVTSYVLLPVSHSQVSLPRLSHSLLFSFLPLFPSCASPA